MMLFVLGPVEGIVRQPLCRMRWFPGLMDQQSISPVNTKSGLNIPV
jgi:hypothetical protein